MTRQQPAYSKVLKLDWWLFLFYKPSVSMAFNFFVVDKEAYMPQKTLQNDLYVVVISSKEERDELKALCVKHNIPLLYPELFEEEEIHHLWGISKNGVALVSTMIARHTPKENIFHSVKELECIL